MYVRRCDGEPFVYVSLDIGMGSWTIKRGILQKLKEVGVNLRSDQLIISGTHTHSGPAGSFDYFSFQVTSGGYIDDVTTAIVDGTVASIRQAGMPIWISGLLLQCLLLLHH